MTSPARVMIVEDNATVAEDCRDCLEGLGYAVTAVVASGEEAVEQAHADVPDAVLMDIQLRDEMDGIQAADEIYSSLHTPVVFLSAYSDDKLLQRAKQVGPFGYLVKPFREREVRAALEIALHKSEVDDARRHSEDELRQSQKTESLRSMAGSIAHSLNNKLHVSLASMELARDMLPKGSTADMYVQQADNAVRSAAEMGAQMLVYVGHGQGQIDLVCLHELVAETCDALRQTLPESVALAVSGQADDVSCPVDALQLRQLVEHLVENSAESIQDGTGKIAVSVRRSSLGPDAMPGVRIRTGGEASEYAAIEVSDTGCGMGPEVLVRAFDPFFTTGFTGRGLGLAAVLGIVRRHDGSILVESSPGDGTTVTILLPMA